MPIKNSTDEDVDYSVNFQGVVQFRGRVGQGQTDDGDLTPNMTYSFTGGNRSYESATPTGKRQCITVKLNGKTPVSASCG